MPDGGVTLFVGPSIVHVTPYATREEAEAVRALCIRRAAAFETTEVQPFDAAVIDHSLLVSSLRLMCTAHEGQVDKGGAPYVLHPLAVAAKLGDLRDKVVAHLHDVCEDGGITVAELRTTYGYPEDVVAAVDALTRRPGETKAAYRERVLASGDARALRVKAADVEHNMDLSRIPSPTAKDEARRAVPGADAGGVGAN